MPSSATNRLQGLTTSVAVKPPCITVATSNITLSGLQTISGVTVVEDDRVLVKGQSTASENGIYNASTGSWTRAKDFDGDLDAVSGTRVLVVSAGSNGVEYELTTTDPIVIGTTALTFTLRYGANATYDQTEAEIAAGVTVVNYALPVCCVDRYATNTTPGTTDMQAAWSAAIDVAYQQGGGTVTTLPGSTYYATVAPVLKSGVEIDGGWSRLNLTLGTGDVFGVRIVTNSGIRRLRIYVTSTGSPSSQYIFHAPISIGAPNNNGDSAGSVNAFQTAYNWFIEDVELGNSREFGPCIQGMGDIYNGTIRRVSIPDSSTCSGVHLDWGNVGTTQSSDIAGTKISFQAGNSYTTHPHNITIEDVICGNLSVTPSGDLGSHIVRLSACYNVMAKNLEAENVTRAGWAHTGGDLGFEFALASIKPHACKGNKCEGIVLTDMQSTASANGAIIDTLADNIYREQFLAGYVPLMNPLMHGDVTLERCSLAGPNADSQYGARIIQARGVSVKGVSAQKWQYGIWVDELTRDILVEGCDVFANRQHGIVVGTQLLRENTKNIHIRGNRAYGNGTDSASNGIRIVRGHDVWVTDNTLGTSDEATQNIGVVVVDNGPANRFIHVLGNHVEGATVSGFSLTASSPSAPFVQRQVASFRNNTCAAGVVVFTGGQSLIPTCVDMLQAAYAGEWINLNASAPSTGSWYRGELLRYSEPAAAAAALSSVVTGGTFGTLSGLTNAATTNTSAAVTMSLAARTATTTANSYSVTVSSATNIRAGLKCSISAAGITDATILDVTGTTLQLDVPANATQSGGAFVTAGVIEGEVISLNTTPAIASAIVLKVAGTTVTLNTAASSTETGRTASYTTPVFKDHANITA